MSIINTKQINSPLNITGSLYGTSSWAEYVVNGGTGGGFPYVGNAVISGSLLISGSGLTVTGSLNSQNITGSLRGTASFAVSASISSTASFVNGNVFTSANAAAYSTNASNINVANKSDNQDYAVMFTTKDVNGYIQPFTDFPSDFLYNPSTNRLTIPNISASSGITGSLRGTASFATSASHALNGGVTSINQGSGISISSNTGNITISNAAPDQTVSLTNGGSISITGGYPNFTIQNTAPFPGFGYDQLLYIFSQTGGNDPNSGGGPTVNTTGKNFTFTRSNTGEYRLLCTDDYPFQAGRYAVYLSWGFTTGTVGSGNIYQVWFERISDSIIDIYSFKLSGGSLSPYDDVFENATLDIKFYP